jgi:hypothetical protein
MLASVVESDDFWNPDLGHRLGSPLAAALEERTVERVLSD